MDITINATTNLIPYKHKHKLLDLSNSDLSGQCLVREEYNPLLPGVPDGGPGWGYVDFSGSRLVNTDLRGGLYHDCDFSRCDLRGTNFTKAPLAAAIFTDAIVEHNYNADKWRALGLLPLLGDGSVLLWKHVTAGMKGNADYQYHLGVPFECACMGTAGPMGALKDWRQPGISPHLLAVAAHALYDHNYEGGTYYALHGTPLALYRADDITDDGFTPVLLASTPGEGADPLSLLTGGSA